MMVKTDATEAGGRLWSRWFEVNGENTITVSRRTLQHYAGNVFSGVFRLHFDTNNDGEADFSFGVDHANNSYQSGSYCAKYGFFLVPNSFGWSDGSYQCAKPTSGAVTAIWDEWFDEKLVYDPVTGILQYFVNNALQTELNVGSLPDATNYQMRVHVQAWGWSTGHYDYFDNLVVTQDASVIAIDIKPGSSENTINLGSAEVIPVAILGSDTFDTSTIEPGSLFLSGANVKLAGKSVRSLCHEDDVNTDGYTDMVCQFETADFMIEEGSDTAELSGQTTAGMSFIGSDSITIVP